MSRSHLYIKVIRSRSRSKEQTTAESQSCYNQKFVSETSAPEVYTLP